MEQQLVGKHTGISARARKAQSKQLTREARGLPVWKAAVWTVEPPTVHQGYPNASSTPALAIERLNGTKVLRAYEADTSSTLQLHWHLQPDSLSSSTLLSFLPSHPCSQASCLFANFRHGCLHPQHCSSRCSPLLSTAHSHHNIISARVSPLWLYIGWILSDVPNLPGHFSVPS